MKYIRVPNILKGNTIHTIQSSPDFKYTKPITDYYIQMQKCAGLKFFIFYASQFTMKDFDI